MGSSSTTFGLNHNFSAFIYLLLILFICCSFIRSGNSQEDPLGVLACDLGNAVHICGEGTCKPTNATLLHFDCVCNPGWKKIDNIGTLSFPSCLVPNCTINLDCGSETPPAPPPPVPLLPPTLNFSDPCGLTWCGDGSCANDGATGHVCNCNQGSYNLLNNTGSPCFKECYLGGDCHQLGFGLPDASSSTGSTINGTSSAPPHPPPSSSTFEPMGQGSNGVVQKFSLRAQYALMTILFLLMIAILV